MLEEIRATFHIVTPMFLGGAAGNSGPELADSIRLPSVKGALRFWWRALQWAKVRPSCKDDAQALQVLHRKEAEIFGLAASDNAGGQANVLLRVRSLAQPRLRSLAASELDREIPLSSGTSTAWQAYLLGQGLMEYRRQDHGFRFTRGAFLEGAFEVRLAVKSGRRGTGDEDIASVREAVELFGLMGGLGSRTRRGLGSVSLTDASAGIAVPRSQSDWAARLSTLVGGPRGMAFPPFTAFTPVTQIHYGPPSRQTGWSALEAVAKELQMERSWGRKMGRRHQVNGRDSEHNFQDDHDIGLAISQGQEQDRHPRRVAYGLPHAYFFSQTRGQARMRPSEAGRDRRGSPLFIHVQQLPSGETFAVQSLIRAEFLPVGDKVLMERKEGRRWEPVSRVSPTPDWAVYDHYFARPAFSGWHKISFAG